MIFKQSSTWARSRMFLSKLIPMKNEACNRMRYSNPNSVMGKVFDFLDIEQKDYPNKKYEVKNKTPQMSKIEEFLFRSNLIKFSQLFPVKWKNKIKVFLRQQTSLSSKRSFSEEEYKKVYSKLYEDMLKLKKEFGVDISQWGFY